MEFSLKAANLVESWLWGSLILTGWLRMATGLLGFVAEDSLVHRSVCFCVKGLNPLNRYMDRSREFLCHLEFQPKNMLQKNIILIKLSQILL